MTACSFAAHILCMVFGALGTKWEDKDNQLGEPDSAINRNAINGVGDSFYFGGEALAA